MDSVKVVLRNYQTKETIDYNIIPQDNQLAQDWITALKKDVLQKSLHLEKNFCFHGFPHTQRTLEYLCNELNRHIYTINTTIKDYWIEEWFAPDVVRYGVEYPVNPGIRSGNRIPENHGLELKHDIMNKLHNHFEVLQGTVEHPSEYSHSMTPETTYAVRQLNNICHEIESLVLSQRKLVTDPPWVRPSQITTFLRAPRHLLTDEHRQGFLENSYDRILGGVYMHWCQIGKTLMEVYRDEGAPVLTETVCEAITHLQYYSGEFDIEWGNDIMYDMRSPWHCAEIDGFEGWLKENNFDPYDPKLSLGYLKLGEVDLLNSFGTTNAQDIWKQMGDYLDIYKIECGTASATYDYHWSDTDHEQRQLESLR
jgi:adenylate kinase family enzyme